MGGEGGGKKLKRHHITSDIFYNSPPPYLFPFPPFPSSHFPAFLCPLFFFSFLSLLAAILSLLPCPSFTVPCFLFYKPPPPPPCSILSFHLISFISTNVSTTAMITPTLPPSPTTTTTTTIPIHPPSSASSFYTPLFLFTNVLASSSFLTLLPLLLYLSISIFLSCFYSNLHPVYFI